MSKDARKLKSFEDMNLEVGTKLQLVVVHNSKKIMSFTSLIGYEPNDYMFVKIPQANSLDVPLIVGERVDIRVFSGVAIYDFSCTVEAIYQGRRKLLELSFPKEIQQIPLRRDLRANVSLAVKVCPSHSSEDTDAVLRDLSASGAQVESEAWLGEVGQELDISLQIINNVTQQEFVISNKASIKNRHEKTGRGQGQTTRYKHGVQFNNLSDSDTLILQNYVYESFLLKRT